LSKLNHYEWRLNALYKKWELYLYRLFKLAQYVEETIKYPRLGGPEIEELLAENGYTSELITIPPNPFIDKDEDIFIMFYDYLSDLQFRENDAGFRDLLFTIWHQIGDIKTFLGITKGTRYIGEEREEWRLCNELEWYLKYPENAPMIYKLILGTNEDSLLSFRRFLMDRRRISKPISIKNYQSNR